MLRKINKMLFSTKSNSQHDIIPLNSTESNTESISLLPPYERIICQQLLTGVSTLEMVRDSLLNSSNDLKREQDAIDELNQRNDEAKQALEKLVNFIVHIETNANQSTDSLTEFRKSIDQIKGCVSEINKLSNQTNLIAINSAIEAAHVGNKGRGFSVIAKEIKSLSGEVKESTDDIFHLTKSIEDNTIKVCSIVSEQKPLIEHIKKDISNIVDSINIVIARSSHMQSIIAFITNLQFLNIVKIDHVIWKLQIYKLLLDNNNSVQVNSHTECRLGKWYAAGDGRNLAHYPAYQQLEKPHAAVHHSGRIALSAFFDDNIDAMTSALEHMETASNEVVELIDRLASDMTPNS
ncbi:methyl-accepting chemotaxis protein [Yersinia nurmii]|uniref:Methyl-accepting chemotaxis protein n=1 Tax=Yersinia nurmii TaxID=685706 RepID=A0AAW7K6K8_9GAMM|nr:methyl-accepting chemotaxis protein [Yersinia nurmii]MDN0087174.1 methyl-accepting chemotaxis protein [Yersinia nurmii]